MSKQYRSKRGHLLLTQITYDKPVLTLEAYCTWYEMHLLHPDGTVTEVDPSVVLEVASGLWIDRNYHPKALLLVAKHLDAYFCELSLEVAAGRCVLMGVFGFEDYPLGGYFLEKEDESLE